VVTYDDVEASQKLLQQQLSENDLSADPPRMKAPQVAFYLVRLRFHVYLDTFRAAARA